MDKKIKKVFWTVKRLVAFVGFSTFLLFIGYQFMFADHRPTTIVRRETVSISTVKRGEFKEYIPQTGIIQPSHQVFLDAVEGGIIKSISRESGAFVKKGDEILSLTNLNRELAVWAQEASFNESINRARETRVKIMSNDMENRQTLAAIRNQLDILKPQYGRQKRLFEKNLISKQDFERTEADYNYNVERYEIVYRMYKSDSADRIRALTETAQSERRMMKSLEGVRRILDNLVIRATMDGQLSMAHWEIGQSIAAGQRLGEVNNTTEYKVRVPIDELYLPRISTGLPASADFAGKTYDLEVSYIYPNIVNGRFEADMIFARAQPVGIRRGQSLRLRIELGQPSEELLLPMGGFYKDTGGNWVFILDGTDKAVRRNIKLGRKMGSEYFEVLEGLSPGDQVITSAYENFGNNEVLIFR
jgi:HlyD family secretion protein